MSSVSEINLIPIDIYSFNFGNLKRSIPQKFLFDRILLILSFSYFMSLKRNWSEKLSRILNCFLRWYKIINEDNTKDKLYGGLVYILENETMLGIILDLNFEIEFKAIVFNLWSINGFSNLSIIL